MNNEYKKRVELLLKIVPQLYDIDTFAIHGGTAINLYVLDFPRYSVDIDLTYTLIKPRDESFAELHQSLLLLKECVRRVVPNVIITEKPNKILCNDKGVMVKVEVSGIKRGLIEATELRTLSAKAQQIFEVSNKARIVSLSQLYGGKITAALDRQHPRDLFDVKLMFDIIKSFDGVKRGFINCLLGGDRPIVESLSPNRIDQSETLVNQFAGMTEIPFSYNDYEETREKLVDIVNSNLTGKDKEFLLNFESGNPDWQNSEYADFQDFPAIQWKLLNINKLKFENPAKFRENSKKLEEAFGI